VEYFNAPIICSGILYHYLEIVEIYIEEQNSQYIQINSIKKDEVHD
jgi:hypothetical protein